VSGYQLSDVRFQFTRPRPNIILRLKVFLVKKLTQISAFKGSKWRALPARDQLAILTLALLSKEILKDLV
jgi:hypothetical protein